VTRPLASSMARAAALLALALVGLGCHEVTFKPETKAGSIQIYDDLFSVSAPTPDHVVAAGYWGSIYVSDDGGKTWKKGETDTRRLL